MNFNDNFRNRSLINSLIREIQHLDTRPVRIMEVCGGHTMAIRRSGIQTLLPENIGLLSGPGCPVCVTGQHIIDKAIAYARQPEIIVLTYGDLLRVPGSSSSLEKERAMGSDVRVIYSTIQGLEIARQNPTKKIVFIAIGFETTVPGTALAVEQAEAEKLENFFILSAHKTMPEAMGTLIDEGIRIDGYIGPGHVCAVAGSKIFYPVAEKYHIPIVISGFEPLDLVQSIYMLVRMIKENRYGVEIQYSRVVSAQGNSKAQSLVDEVFEPCNAEWRGIGMIERSGLSLRKKYAPFNVEIQIPVVAEKTLEPKGCLCGNILKGLNMPTDCPLFGSQCTPSHPIGACMVSSEGACQAYFNYKSF